MDQIPKVFLGILFILFLVFGGTSIVAAHLSASQAREYKNNMVTEIENSDFNPTVISACVSEANEREYTAKITLYYEDQTVSDISNGISDDKKIYMADITLSYKLKIPFFQIEKEFSTRGIAR